MRILNILVAEDDDQNQAMMKIILDRLGHNVFSAWNGLAALEIVKNNEIDLVFMDVHMPEMDGLEASMKIRAWENTKKHIPIIILSGSVSDEVIEEYKKAGADTYITKPFDIKRISLLTQIIAGENNQSRIVEQQETNTAFPESTVLDTDNSLIRFDNNINFYIENLSEFLNSLPVRAEKIENSITTGNFTDLENFAHNLKGVSSNFGAKKLSLIASQIEIEAANKKIRTSKKLFREMKHQIFTLTELASNFIKNQKLTNPDQVER